MDTLIYTGPHNDTQVCVAVFRNVWESRNGALEIHHCMHMWRRAEHPVLWVYGCRINHVNYSRFREMHFRRGAFKVHHLICQRNII